MNLYRYGLLLILCCTPLFFSCTDRAYYEQYQIIENPWNKEKEYFFIYEIKDNTASYDLSLEIRNNTLYPYQNLWLFCVEEQPVGPVKRDTFECMLADEYGKWKGNGISIHHLSVPIRTNYTFPHKGRYVFSIRQGMRKEELKGIEEIGLHIEKTTH